MTKGYLVVKTEEGEMPKYFYGRNYKWLDEPTDGCFYRTMKGAQDSLEKCKRRYGNNRTRFSIAGADEKITKT